MSNGLKGNMQIFKLDLFYDMKMSTMYSTCLKGTKLELNIAIPVIANSTLSERIYLKSGHSTTVCNIFVRLVEQYGQCWSSSWNSKDCILVSCGSFWSSFPFWNRNSWNKLKQIVLSIKVLWCLVRSQTNKNKKTIRRQTNNSFF